MFRLFPTLHVFKSIVFMGTAFKRAPPLGLAKSAYELTYKEVPFLNGREDEIMLLMETSCLIEKV